MNNYGYELDQFLGSFHEDWTHEFDDPYALASWHIEGMRPSRLVELHLQLKEWALTDPQLDSLTPECQIGARLDDQAAFVSWLDAVQRRVEQALAGDHSQPLVAP